MELHIHINEAAGSPVKLETTRESGRLYEMIDEINKRLKKLEQVTAAIEASSKTSTKTGQLEPNSYSFTQDKLVSEMTDLARPETGLIEPTATYEPLPPKLATDKKKKPYPMYPPPANQCGTKQGAAVALIADGVPCQEALNQAGVGYVGRHGAVSFCSVHRLHIKNMRALPPGQARFEYLQKHYSWGLK